MPQYIKKLIKNHPRITSGRKNFYKQHKRIMNTLKIIKLYFKIND